MRKKEKKRGVTFHTTSDPMARAKAGRQHNAPGRLIPVPRSISAGCGMAWCAALEDRDRILQVLEERKIEQEDVHECMLCEEGRILVRNSFFLYAHLLFP